MKRAVAALLLGTAFTSFATAADPLPSVLPQGDSGALSTRLTIHVKEFRFEGNTAISTRNLNEIAKKYAGRNLSIEDLEQARVEIGQLYVRRGYVNSGAVLPDQDLVGGIVVFKIIEGRLSEIHVNPVGKHLLRSKYIKDRIELGAGPPLNINHLQGKLEILRQDPNVARVNAELRPGAIAGSSILDVNYAETNPFQLGLEFNNHRSPVIGAERIYALASDSDLTGNGDRLAVRYGIVEGGFDQMRLAGDHDYSVDYVIPITAHDTTLAFDYTKSDDLVVEDPFQSANISSTSQSFSATLRQPIYKTPNDEFAVSVSGARRSNDTSVLGRPFSFTYGTVNGKSEVAVVRFGQEFTRRAENDSIALRSTFSVGLDALGSTATKDGIGDSVFFAWLGQVQYVRRIGQSDSLLILRAAAQFANDALPPLEQFSMGGFDTVRGYRENRVVRDNGVAATAEVQIPIFRHSGRNIVTLAPFFDCGYAFDNDSPSAGKPQFISSVGTGILITPNQHVSAQLYYGYPLKHFENASENIQDYGLHFDVLLLAF